MIDHTQRMIAIALMAATMGAVSSCHSEESQPLTLASPSLPAASPQASFPPSSLLGTVPVSGSDERAITPTETVGASSD
jgi:hypothetical protein